MAAYSAILPPASIGEALRPIRDLSENEFSNLVAALSGPRSFSLSKDDIEKLRNELPGHGANITFFVAALSFLYSHISRLVELGMPFDEAISSLTNELNPDAEWGEKIDEVKRRFGQIFSSQNHQRFRKLDRLQSGFLPNAVGFSTFVDLRPDFGDGQDLSLRGYLPVIQFRVSTDSDNSEEKRILFQVSETTLTELKKAIDRAEQKLLILRKQQNLAAMLAKF
jgi:hypothetical protein